jgi:TolB-like protein/class 3 adenylate cyclase/Tfp pilus assembly protein PilF
MADNKRLKRHRKLAAIMFTDMVGYSALTQKNESLAIDLLEEHRHILRPLFIKHGGTEVETIGDAFFVEFRSALESMHCAIEIQKTLHERNSNLPSEKHIRLRIGLHVGDVIHLGDHVHGDGVNIAARLEPLSNPGGICFSGDVASQIHNKIEFPLKKLQSEKLKNIESPVDVHCLLLPWEKNEESSDKGGFFKFAKSKTFIFTTLILILVALTIFLRDLIPTRTDQDNDNRIAVLPLVNISEDSQDDYFADGMTEEVISQLAKISGLNVIARTSVMKYKKSDMNIEEIGDELNVGTILAGSVRKTRNKARITIQLIDVETQEYLWTEEYDRELKDIFTIQSDIALKIANELKVQLITIEEQLIKKTGTENAEAYRSYLLGRFYFNKRTEESIFRSLDYFNSAVELDPKYALAWVGIADCYALIGGAGYGSLPRDEVVKKANEAVTQAFELDNTLAEAYNAKAYINFRLEWNWKEAEKNFKRTIELKPGYAAAYERYAFFLALMTRYDDALKYMQRAQQLDPLSSSVNTGIGRIYHFSHQYDKAIKQYKMTLEKDPDYVEALLALGLTYHQKRMYKEEIEELKKAVELSNGRMIIVAFLGRAYAGNGMKEEAIQILNDLKQQQDKKTFSQFYSMIVNAALGNKQIAIDALFKAYDEHFGLLVYIRASPAFDSIRNEPRFEELLLKMDMK